VSNSFENWKKQQNPGTANPFYDNHVFNKLDVERAVFSKWNWVWLWLYPTYVQISEGYVWKYKIVNGEYWLTGSSPTPTTPGGKK